MHKLEVFVENRQKDLLLSEDSVKPIVKSLLSLEKRKGDFVAIYFVSRQKISALHKKFFHDPSMTDCISFPLDEEIWGDVFVCPLAAMSYVKKNGGDVYEETTLYVIHGLLHLLGYDDLSDKEERKMRAAEKRHMGALKRKKLLLKPP